MDMAFHEQFVSFSYYKRPKAFHISLPFESKILRLSIYIGHHPFGIPLSDRVMNLLFSCMTFMGESHWLR